MKITTNPKHLAVKCSPVRSFDAGYMIGRKLINTCLLGKYSHAVGLAHTQIGGNKRVYVVKDKNWKIYIDPKVVGKSKETYDHVEGCMSYPGKDFKVIRHEWITIQYLTRSGVERETFDGFLACVHQHELDHLDGLTIKHKERRYSDGL
jgi:peptide deformylase